MIAFLRFKIFLFVLSLMLFQACISANSSELESTRAEDIRFLVQVIENVGREEATIFATPTTLSDYRRIELNQGETIFVQTQSDSQTSEVQYLSHFNLLPGIYGIDGMYHKDIEKLASDGSYIVTYEDQDGVKTSVTLPGIAEPEIFSPIDGDSLSGNTLEIAWDSLDLIHEVHIETFYVKDGEEIRSQQQVSNTGSYELDTSDFEGDVTITLIHKKREGELIGFGDGSANISVKHQIQVEYPTGL